MLADEFELFYGGQKGSGKSNCIIGWLLKGNPDVPIDQATPIDISYINCSDYRALVIRKNLEDLNSWVSEAYRIYSKLGANYTQKPNEFTFPSGAKIIIGHLDDERAAEKYFGNVVHRAAVDELTFIPELDTYMKLYSCVRSNVKGIRAQILLTGNPGGPGTPWVVDRFIEPKGLDGEALDSSRTITESNWNPFTKKVENMTRLYIFARLADNPKMLEVDPLYYNRLLGLPEAQRRAYLEGDWHALGGTFFTEFRSKHREGEPPEACHVIPIGSRPLLPWLPRLGGCDYGFGHHAVVYGAVKDLNGQTIVHREIFVKETGTVELGDAIARLFLPDLEGLYRSGASPLIPIYLSPDAFEKNDAKTQAESIADGIARVLGPKSAHLPDLFGTATVDVSSGSYNLFSQVKIQQKSGISLIRAQNARCAGWSHVREMLRWREIAPIAAERFDYEVYYHLLHESVEKARVYMEAFQHRKKETLPKLLIEDHCKALISSIPALVHDPKNIEDVLITNALCSDVGDSLRYLLYSQGVADNREPKQSFVHRHLDYIHEAEPNIDYNGLCHAAAYAEEKYAEETANLHRSFNVPLESNRGHRDYRKRTN